MTMALPNLTRALQIRRFEEWGLEGQRRNFIGAMKRQQKITFGETRAFGVHDALVLPRSSLQPAHRDQRRPLARRPRFVCTACGKGWCGSAAEVFAGHSAVLRVVCRSAPG